MTRCVHLIIGTKAQFIKMAPIAYVMDREGIPYRIIDLSQHGALTGKILADFGLQPDIRFLHPTGANVSTYSAAASWLGKCVRQIARRKARLRESLLLPGGSPVALVHGDTLSTLLGAYLGNRLGIEVGLVEAGLSSGRLFSPFPEEAIRRHVERRVDFLFAAGDQAYERLVGRRLKGSVHNTGYNTGQDAFQLIAKNVNRRALECREPYTVLTLHRAETITRPRRLKAIVHHVLALAEHLPQIRFFVHEPTLRGLRRAGLLDVIESHPRITMMPLAPYPDFVATLLGAEAVLTDGGSIQEEAAYAGKPCLVLRRETERDHGIGETAKLTTLDVQEDLHFLRSRRRRDVARDNELAASRRILAALGALPRTDGSSSARVADRLEAPGTPTRAGA